MGTTATSAGTNATLDLRPFRRQPWQHSKPPNPWFLGLAPRFLPGAAALRHRSIASHGDRLRVNLSMTGLCLAKKCKTRCHSALLSQALKVELMVITSGLISSSCMRCRSEMLCCHWPFLMYFLRSLLQANKSFIPPSAAPSVHQSYSDVAARSVRSDERFI